MAGLALVALAVLASAGPARAPESALAHTDDQSGYFGSGHEPEREARSAAPLA